MSWTPDLYIGELRPWPDAVLVRRGDTDETMQYTVTPLPHFWTGDGTLHVEAARLPERIDVTLLDKREREVHSARVHRFVPERTCYNTQSDFDFMCSECHKCVDNGRVLGFRYCPRCGRRIVPVDLEDE